MKSTDSGNEINARMEQVLAAHDLLTLPPLAAKILERLNDKKHQTIGDIEDAHCFRDESRSTLKLRLRELVRTGLVRKHGKGKATWYTL